MIISWLRFDKVVPVEEPLPDVEVVDDSAENIDHQLKSSFKDAVVEIFVKDLSTIASSLKRRSFASKMHKTKFLIKINCLMAIFINKSVSKSVRHSYILLFI